MSKAGAGQPSSLELLATQPSHVLFVLSNPSAGEAPFLELVIFSTIAVYEQVGSPESMIESFATIPKGTLDFPTLDTSRFAESVYRPL
jgi:hypothetical protein